MKRLARLFLDELEIETRATRRVLEQVPEGRDEWKPHEKSMPLGYLAALVATMPRWIGAILLQDDLDLAAQGDYQAPTINSNAELLATLEASMEIARKALEGATDEHMGTMWQMKVQGIVVLEQTRFEAIRESVLNHLYHHRGQLTVYLRLNDRMVPSVYGPTADEPSF